MSSRRSPWKVKRTSNLEDICVCTQLKKKKKKESGNDSRVRCVGVGVGVVVGVGVGVGVAMCSLPNPNRAKPPRSTRVTLPSRYEVWPAQADGKPCTTLSRPSSASSAHPSILCKSSCRLCSALCAPGTVHCRCAFNRHSARRADRLSGPKPVTTKSSWQGANPRVALAPPLSAPSCWRILRVRLLVIPA